MNNLNQVTAEPSLTHRWDAGGDLTKSCFVVPDGTPHARCFTIFSPMILPAMILSAMILPMAVWGGCGFGRSTVPLSKPQHHIFLAWTAVVHTALLHAAQEKEKTDPPQTPPRLTPVHRRPATPFLATPRHHYRVPEAPPFMPHEAPQPTLNLAKPPRRLLTCLPVKIGKT